MIEDDYPRDRPDGAMWALYAGALAILMGGCALGVAFGLATLDPLHHDAEPVSIPARPGITQEVQ